MSSPLHPERHNKPGRKPGRARHLQEAIEAIVKDIPRGVHLTAPEVYRRAQEQGLQLSLSTVYRTLNLLQAHGNVSTVTGEHGKRYEARHSDHDHDHLICVKCGLTIEFTDELIRGFGRALADRKGYEHASSRFDILGVCSECKSKDEDHKIATAIAALQNTAEHLTSAIENIRNAVALLETRKMAKAAEPIKLVVQSLLEASAEAEQANSVVTHGPLNS
jgi:Fur family transcriptional regulator, ferric uptake regulator